MAGDVDDDPDAPLAWNLGDNTLTATLGDWRLSSWMAYEKTGQLLTDGGWEAQPLAWLVMCHVFSLTKATFTGRHTEQFRFDKLSRLQNALLTWLEKEP